MWKGWMVGIISQKFRFAKFLSTGMPQDRNEVNQEAPGMPGEEWPGIFRAQLVLIKYPGHGRGIVYAILVMSWFLLADLGGSMAEGDQPSPSAGGHEIAHQEYVGSDPVLKVRFEYPRTWSLREEHGQIDVYRLVRLLGPRNQDDSYTAYIAIQGAPLKDAGGKFQHLEEAVASYTSHLAPGATLVSSTSTQVAGAPAQDLFVTYTMPSWHHRGLKAVEIPIKARAVFVALGPYLYHLSYSADAREYDRHAEVFEQALRTFRVQ